MSVPSRQDALKLLEQHQGAKPERIAHSVAVAGLAGAVAEALNARGDALNVPLVEAAALLHDICKGVPDHDRAAGDLLRSLGLPEVAAVAELHTDLGQRIPGPDDPVSAAEVVFIADKSYRRSTRVSVRERYGIWKRNWEHDHGRTQILHTAEQRALAVLERVEKALGCALEAVRAKAD